MARVALGIGLLALSLLALSAPAQAGLITNTLCHGDDCSYEGPACDQAIKTFCETGTSLGFCFLYLEATVLTVCV